MIRKRARRSDVIDRSGQKFGRLTFVRHDFRDKWVVLCDCGTVKVMTSYAIIIGRLKSCGMCQKNRDRRMPRLQVLRNARLARYKSQAAQRGYTWELSEELFDNLIVAPCFYCSEAPSPFNGIDRVNNSKGYSEENCVSCCRQCNLAKLDMPLSDFLNWACRVAHKAGF